MSCLVGKELAEEFKVAEVTIGKVIKAAGISGVHFRSDRIAGKVIWNVQNLHRAGRPNPYTYCWVTIYKKAAEACAWSCGDRMALSYDPVTKLARIFPSPAGFCLTQNGNALYLRFKYKPGTWMPIGKRELVWKANGGSLYLEIGSGMAAVVEVKE